MLITGANGFIGSRLAQRALDRGYLVKTLTRVDWDGAPAVSMDLRFCGSLPDEIPAQALENVDVVVHCAASIDTDENKARAINVDGTMRLAEWSRQVGVSSFIFLSSQSAKPDALSAYGKTKHQAEKALLELDGLNVVILRPGLVTGAGSRGLYQRLSQTVKSLPVIPLMGGRAIVQPIHVDDLCEAIFRCVDSAQTLNGRILNLGDPVGLTLADFLQKIAIAQKGKQTHLLPVPLRPVEIAVGMAERLGVPLPISTGNIAGMKLVERMETEADLKLLNLSLRSVDETVRSVDSAALPDVPLTNRPVRILLIGAGRVGLVHALTLSRLKGAVLCGVVDPNSKAQGILKGMGLSAPMFETLDAALEQKRPDAAVIATPPITHFSLARKCLERGVAVLVEKPLAVSPQQLDDYARLLAEFPQTSIEAGYVMIRNPQVSSQIDRLRAGDFGKVTGFTGFTLISLIEKGNLKRWEVKKEVAGGGAFINAGGHVLSMIHAAFDAPLSVKGQTLKIHSTEVEDSMVVNFDYGDFQGTHYCSWSIPGYPRQENKLMVQTERGQLILTTSVGIFAGNDGAIDVNHQLDSEVGFNLAPDYAGAGFAVELADLRDSVFGQRSAFKLGRTIELERLLFEAYENSHETKSFEPINIETAAASSREHFKLTPKHSPSTSAPERITGVLDLREVLTRDIDVFFSNPVSKSNWTDYLVLPGQYKTLKSNSLADQNVRVTVPDFFNQSRALAVGQYLDVLKDMGVGGMIMAARLGTPMLLRERAPNFWVAAVGLVASGLNALPPEFEGTILLHVYITDLAMTLRRFDVLENVLSTIRRIRPRARVGIHTNLGVEAQRLLRNMTRPIDDVSILTSPGARDVDEVFSSMRTRAPEIRITADVGLAPNIVHQAASENRSAWTHGADALTLGPAAEPLLSQRSREDRERAWARVFPGTNAPAGVL
jgi:predicted dehydrogenase/nucleoside-diphosphate-sugar epimerase